VVLSADARRERQAKQFSVQVGIKVPGGEIVATQALGGGRRLPAAAISGMCSYCAIARTSSSVRAVLR
jgi:hypothetical protein